MPQLFGRRKGGVVQVDPWDTQLDALNPDVWWKFDEASGNFVDEINSWALTPLASLGATGYQRPGPNGSNNAAAFNPSARHGTATNESPVSGASATGTWGVVFRGCAADQQAWIFECKNGFDDDSVKVVVGAGLSFFVQVQNGSTSNNEYQLQFTNRDVDDGNWHFIAFAQTGNGGNNSIIVWLDGVALTPDNVFIGGAFGSTTYWLDDFGNSSDKIIVGGREDTTTNGGPLEIDELFYLDGQVLTTSQVSDLWAGLTGTKTVTPFLEEVIRGQNPYHFHPFQNTTFAAVQNDQGSNNSMDFNQESSAPASYIASGFDPLHQAIQLDASSNGSGDRLVDTSMAAGVMNLSGGWCHAMVRMDDLEPYSGASNFILFAIGDSSNTITNEAYWRFDEFGGAVRIRLEWRDGSPNGYGCVWLGEQTSIDIGDGNWHQILAYQPGDGTGVIWYIDGERFDSVTTPSQIFNGGFGSTSFDEDSWWGDVLALSGVTRASLGGLAPPITFNPFQGAVSHLAFGTGTITDSIAADFWAATGLAA